MHLALWVHAYCESSEQLNSLIVKLEEFLVHYVLREVVHVLELLDLLSLCSLVINDLLVPHLCFIYRHEGIVQRFERYVILKQDVAFLPQLVLLFMVNSRLGGNELEWITAEKLCDILLRGALTLIPQRVVLARLDRIEQLLV